MTPYISSTFWFVIAAMSIVLNHHFSFLNQLSSLQTSVDLAVFGESQGLLMIFTFVACHNCLMWVLLTGLPGVIIALYSTIPGRIWADSETTDSGICTCGAKKLCLLCPLTLVCLGSMRSKKKMLRNRNTRQSKWLIWNLLKVPLLFLCYVIIYCSVSQLGWGQGGPTLLGIFASGHVFPWCRQVGHRHHGKTWC